MNATSRHVSLWATVVMAIASALQSAQAQQVNPVQLSNGYYANMSCRGQVGSGNDTFIMGFVIRDTAKDVLVRAIGPSLSQFGITNGIPDPKLVIFDAAGKVVAQAYALPTSLPGGWVTVLPESTFDSRGHFQSSAALRIPTSS